MYVVYHVASTQEVRRYATSGWAQRHAQKLGAEYDFAQVDDYHARVVTTRTVINFMTGRPITIASNTPLCCDPSSETYWSS